MSAWMGELGRAEAEGRATGALMISGNCVELLRACHVLPDVPRGDGAAERHPAQVAAPHPQGRAGGLLERQLRLRQGRHRPVPRRRHGARQAHPVPDHHGVQLRRLQRLRQVVRAPGRHQRQQALHARRPVLARGRAQRGRRPVRGGPAQGADRALRERHGQEVRHRRAAGDPRATPRAPRRATPGARTSASATRRHSTPTSTPST